MLAPVPPVLVTCGTLEKPNILTVAWTGILSTIPARTYISVRPERFSHALLCETGEFVLNLPTAELVRAVDFCGVKSGADTDKFAQMGLSTAPASAVGAPLLVQSPVNLECRIFETREMGSHTVFFADIVAVNAAKALLDASGRLDLERAGLLAYAHGAYFSLGEKLGTFGYSVRKKPAKRKHKR